MTGKIVAVHGNLVIAETDTRVVQNSVGYCVRQDGVRLLSEVVRVRGRLALRYLPHEPFALLRERDDARRRARALGVRDDRDLGLAPGVQPFEHGDAGVRRAQVDSDDLTHCSASIPR